MGKHLVILFFPVVDKSPVNHDELNKYVSRY